MDGRYKVIILMLTIALLILIATVIIEHKKRKKLAKEIEMVLADFADKDSAKRVLEEICGSRDIESGGKDIDRIYRQLKKLQEAMDNTRARVELEKEETKSIVTDIAHQLKTPVSVMDMSLTILEDESLSGDERREFTERLRSSMDELERLMASLIQISRMETGLIEISKELIPLKNTIMDAVNCIILKAEEKNISIELEVIHDRKWLQEAFINLLDNSLKYSPAGSVISIRPYMRNGFIRLEFEDRGIGIPKDERNKVLTRFYRGKNETVSREKGSGVGLYLVNKIVRMHGGMISIRRGNGSDEFPGSIFIIQLPYTGNGQ